MDEEPDVVEGNYQIPGSLTHIGSEVHMLNVVDEQTTETDEVDENSETMEAERCFEMNLADT